jgi:hypothetical protein
MAELVRNRLTPWFVGLAIIVITDVAAAYLFLTSACSAGLAPDVAAIVLVLVFVVLPAIYLALMYLTLKSQP